jgi:hypothetical protein
MSGAIATPPPGPGAAPGAGPMPPDPTAGAGDDTDSDDNVVCTITKTGDGSYMVYAGDEPEGGDEGDMSDDDTDAMAGGGAPAPGGGGAPPAPQGTPADSVGAALKAALDILNADKSSEGAPGNADDQFAGGFNASKSPTPVGMGGAMAQKY